MRKRLGKAFLSAFGWSEEGESPHDIPKFVLIAAPHTSNWDFPFTLALSYAFDLDIRWMGKHTLFEGPLGWFFKRVGGVPIVRHERRNTVDQMIDLIKESDRICLLVPAEGTRSLRERWKSGFYHIARGADVPVVLGYIDFARKRGGFGPARKMTGDVVADMDLIREFYSDKTGKFPEKFGPIRLREEEEVPQAVA